MTVQSYDPAGHVAVVRQCGGNANPLWWRADIGSTTADVKLGGTSGQLKAGDLAGGECTSGNVKFDTAGSVRAVVYAEFGQTPIVFNVA